MFKTDMIFSEYFLAMVAWINDCGDPKFNFSSQGEEATIA